MFYEKEVNMTYAHRNEIRRIMIAVNVIDGAYDMIAKKIGVKENTLALLYALDDGKSHSQKEISEEWMIPKTTLNTIIKECVEDGYILLHAESHKREKEICLTGKGREYAEEVLGQVYELEEKAMKAVLKTGSSDFIGGLERFTNSLKTDARTFFE